MHAHVPLQRTTASAFPTAALAPVRAFAPTGTQPSAMPAGHDFSTLRLRSEREAPGFTRGWPLQRAEGGSTGGHGVIQRLMSSDAFGTAFGRRSTWLGMRNAYADPHINAIAANIHAFHNVPAAVQAQGAEAVNHHRMAQLHAAEHAAYQWHDANRVAPGHALMQPVQNLLRDIQLEHRNQVGEAVTRGHSLWTPDRAGMNPAQRRDLDNLWRSVTTGQNSRLKVSERSVQGNLGEATQVVPGFKNQVDALHARLMSEPQGRALVQSIVRGKHTTTVRPTHSGYQHDYAAAEVGTGTNPSLSRAEQERARQAFAIEDPHAPGGIRARKGAASRVVVNRDLSDVALQHWDTNSGDDRTKTRGNRILSPAFLIYGHELGHVQHNLAGTNRTRVQEHIYNANRISQARINARLALGPMNAAVPAAQQLQTNWDNAEEHETIEHVENPIRAAHGLSRRKWH